MGCIIKNIDYFLPVQTVDNHELAAMAETWTAKELEQKIGIRERHIADENESALDMAYEASKKVLKSYDRKRIDFILFCTLDTDSPVSISACRLQERLGLGTDIGALDFNLGCSGYIYGLAMAKALINNRMAKTVLLITSEIITKHIHEKDIGNRSIFGDGASATILEEHEEDHILEFVFGTDGSGWEDLVVLQGKKHAGIDKGKIINSTELGGFRKDNYFYMNGPAIFSFTLRAVPGLVEETLKKNGLREEEIDYFIFHQANKYIIEHLRKKIGIPENKFYSDLLFTGNTVSSTIPIALKESLGNSLICPENRVLLCGFGVGHSWGATVIKI
jgi:3-oxoacyl-[acyl-carrier-protein] synthase-3